MYQGEIQEGEQYSSTIFPSGPGDIIQVYQDFYNIYHTLISYKKLQHAMFTLYLLWTLVYNEHFMNVLPTGFVINKCKGFIYLTCAYLFFIILGAQYMLNNN